MDYKTRIFVIDNADVPAMEEDLRNAELLRQQFPGQRIPDDFALFDRALLIAYDIERQVLTFNLLKESSRERQIFESLLTTGRVRLQVFDKIPRTAQAA
jgi:hypothetical protein